MIYRLHIPGRLPGMNEMIAAAKGTGGNGARYSSMKKRWTSSIALIAMAARIPPMTRARFTFAWTEPTPSKLTRLRDPDNIAAGKKIIIDSFVVAKILPNDKLANVAGWTDNFFVDKNPSVVVTVEPVE